MPDNPIQTAGEELSKLLSQLQKIMEMMEAQQKIIKAELKASLKESVDNARYKSLTEHQDKIANELAEANKLAQEQNKHIEALIKNQNNAQAPAQNAAGKMAPALNANDPANPAQLGNDKAMGLSSDKDLSADNPDLAMGSGKKTVAESIKGELQTPITQKAGKFSIDTEALKQTQSLNLGKGISAVS